MTAAARHAAALGIAWAVLGVLTVTGHPALLLPAVVCGAAAGAAAGTHVFGSRS